MRFLSSVLVAFAAFVNAEIPVENGVLVLGDDNFDEALKANDFLLVEFYAPWCGHCKKLAPEWDAAAGVLSSSEESAKLAKVDATVATELAGKFEIKGFPTIKAFKGGNAKGLEYSGGRTSGEIVNWVKKQSGPPAKLITSKDEVAKLHEEADAFVVGYFESANSEGAKNFLSHAGFDDSLTYAISHHDDIKAHLAVSGDAVVVLKNFDDKRADLSVTDATSVEAIAEFVSVNSVPLVQTFSQEAARTIFASPIQKHALFFTDSAADHHETTLSLFRDIAMEFRGKVLHINVPHTEDRVMDYFGIKKDDLPFLVVADMSAQGQMKKFPFTGSFSADEVSAFEKAFLAGELKPVLKSEKVTAEDTANPVKVVKGESFKEIVLDNTKDVLVEFYAPWCGHCKKLAPTWDALAEKLQGEANVVIAKMDSTANEVDVDGLVVKGYPTIYFFKGDDKTPVKYEQGREVDDFVQFLKDNGSNKLHSEL